MSRDATSFDKLLRPLTGRHPSEWASSVVPAMKGWMGEGEREAA